MKNLDQNTRQLLMDSQKGSKDQAIRDRYHGTNDKLADKYLARATAMALEPPTDPAVKSLWVGGVDAAISQEDIKDKFYAFGELTNIKVVSAQRCAFVEVTIPPLSRLASRFLLPARVSLSTPPFPPPPPLPPFFPPRSLRHGSQPRLQSRSCTKTSTLRGTGCSSHGPSQ
jgi:hypothetical protein